MTYAPAMDRTRTAPVPAVPGSAPIRGWVRLARAGILGATSMLLATAGHVIGGGTLPPAGLLALVAGAVGLLAVSVTGRRLRLGPLLVVLGVEQIALHLLVHATATVSACTSVLMPAHGMTSTTVCSAASASSGGWPMLGGHLLALLATAWLLARGEQWLWHAVERVRTYATVRPSLRRRRAEPPVLALLVAAPVAAGWSAAAPRGPPAV